MFLKAIPVNSKTEGIEGFLMQTAIACFVALENKVESLHMKAVTVISLLYEQHPHVVSKILLQFPGVNQEMLDEVSMKIAKTPRQKVHVFHKFLQKQLGLKSSKDLSILKLPDGFSKQIELNSYLD